MDLIGKIGGSPNFSDYEPGGVSSAPGSPRSISFVIMAAVVYFFIVVPYTKAKERFFPSPEPGHAGRRPLLQEIRDLLAAQQGGPPTTPTRSQDPWCGGTCSRSHASEADSPPLAGTSSRSSLVVSGSTSPKTSARRLRRSHSVSGAFGASGPSAWARRGSGPSGAEPGVRQRLGVGLVLRPPPLPPARAGQVAGADDVRG